MNQMFDTTLIHCHENPYGLKEYKLMGEWTHNWTF